MLGGLQFRPWGAYWVDTWSMETKQGPPALEGIWDYLRLYRS